MGPGTPVRPGELAEGSSLVRWNDEWLLYWDAYASGHYSLATSDDLTNWTDQTASLSLPASHPRHGTVFRVDRADVGWELRLPIDLNADGNVNGADWSIFRENNLTDLAPYSRDQQARRGDLDGDGDNDFQDFRLYQRHYETMFGADAFVQLSAGTVPEPATTTIVGGAGIFLLAYRGRLRAVAYA